MGLVGGAALFFWNRPPTADEWRRWVAMLGPVGELITCELPKPHPKPIGGSLQMHPRTEHIPELDEAQP